MKNKLSKTEKDGLHKFRLKALDNAKAILKSETISPMFFAELMLALPESMRLIQAYSLVSDCDFFQAKRLLLNVAGIVITKGYANTPKLKPHGGYTDKDWEWHNACKKVGEEFISDIEIKESTLTKKGIGSNISVGMIGLCPERFST